MTIKTFILLAIISTLVIISCNKSTPTGFWQNYKTDLLVKNMSDQGPQGGHRALYRKSEKPLTFDIKDILDFAVKNGWTLTDSSVFDPYHTKKQTKDNKEIFPLSDIGFNDTLTSTSTNNYFPRWFDGEINLYKFKTGWVILESGTDNSIEENGFVLLNQDKSQLAVYHLWEE